MHQNGPEAVNFSVCWVYVECCLNSRAVFYFIFFRENYSNARCRVIVYWPGAVSQF